MKNIHNASDLMQMQSLSLSSKERMSIDRISDWVSSWVKYEIYDEATDTTRFCTMDTDPEESFYFTIVKGSQKKVIVTDERTIEMLEYEVLDKKPFLKSTESIEFKEDGQVYVSRSGGKDSDVLGDLVKKHFPDVPHIFINTGLEDNTVRRHGIAEADIVLTPEKNFAQIIKEYGYPVISKEIAHKIYDYRSAKKHGRESYVERQIKGTYVSKNGKTNMIDIAKYEYLLDAPFRISHLCCNYSKKLPAHKYEQETGRKPFIGTLAEESMLRRSKWIKYGCNAFNEERPKSQPLSFWTEQDILAYIKLHEIDIAGAYGDIQYMDRDGFTYDNPIVTDGLTLTTTKADRTGCVFCLFGIAYDDTRLLRLKENDPAKYNYVMSGGEFDSEGYWVPTKEGLGYKFIVEWLNKHGDMNIKY